MIQNFACLLWFLGIIPRPLCWSCWSLPECFTNSVETAEPFNVGSLYICIYIFVVWGESPGSLYVGVVEKSPPHHSQGNNTERWSQCFLQPPLFLIIQWRRQLHLTWSQNTLLHWDAPKTMMIHHLISSIISLAKTK